jgi:hypothetical protein
LKIERELLQTFVDLGVVHPSTPSTLQVKLNKPFIPEGTVDLAEAPTGGFAPAAGTFPQQMGGGIEVIIQITVTPPAVAPGSSWNGMMRLIFTQSGGGVSDEMELNLTASTEVPSLELRDVPDFGKTAVGESIAGKISVRNPNVVTPVHLTGLTGLGGDFSLDPSFPGFPITITPGNSLGIPVLFAPSANGPSSVDISITNSIGAPINAQIRGEGMPGEVMLLSYLWHPIDGSGQTDWIEIDIPKEATSIQFVGVDLTGGLVDVTILEGPDGHVYTDNFSGPWIWWLGYPSGYDGWLSCQLPNSDTDDTKLDWRGGTYRFRMMTSNPGAGGMFVGVIYEQRWAGYTSKGTVPVNVYIADGIPLSVADAPTDTRMQTVLGTCDAILGQVGMRLGDITYHKLTWLPWDTIGSVALYEDLVSNAYWNSTPAPQFNKLHLYFIRDLNGVFLDAVGVASASPGIKYLDGWPYSGVVMEYEGASAFSVGSTTAHEIGHFLGLMHTVEENGIFFDIIEDTLECPAYGTNAICTEEGANYLMHWADLGPEGTLLTQGQRRVMLRQVHVQPGLPPEPWVGGTLTGLAGIDIPVQFAEANLGLPMRKCANCMGIHPPKRQR